MKKARYLRIYDLHSWSGITLGLFVYMVSLTGCFALFDHELKSWEDSAKRLEIAESIAPIMPEFQSWVNNQSQNQSIEFITFFYPDKHEPYYKALMGTKAEDDKQTRHEIRWNSEHKQVLVTKQGGLTEWLLDFHRDLMWPAQLGGRTIGRALVGVAGIILMLSIITGIITHTKIIREFFTLRVKRSIHLKWQDLHKVLGLWALPFYTMIAFTGAFLGIIVLLSPIVAVVAFKGDTEALVAAVIGEAPKPNGVHAQMLSVDELRDLRHPVSNNRPNRVVMRNWGDETAFYEVLYTSKTELATFDQVTVSGATGEVIKSEPSGSVPAANRVTNAISPLHYATYGGIWLKVLYFVLGIFLCVVTATGLMVWIERRLKSNKGQQSPRFYQRLGQFSIGIILGFPLATVAIFYVDKLYAGAESARLLYTGISYFMVVMFTVVFAMLRNQNYQTVRVLFFAISISLLGLPIVNTLATQAQFWNSLGSNQSWAWVDLSFIIGGAILTIISVYLPKQRSTEPREPSHARAVSSLNISAEG